MTGQAVLAEFLDRQIALSGRIEDAQRGDTSFGLFVSNIVDSDGSVQIRLRAKREANTGNRTRVGGLDAGHHTLDVIALVRFAPGVTVAPATRRFRHGQVRRVCPPAQRTVCQVRIQGKTFPTVTDDTAKGLDWMRWADSRQVTVTGETIFGLAGQGRN